MIFKLNTLEETSEKFKIRAIIKLIKEVMKVITCLIWITNKINLKDADTRKSRTSNVSNVLMKCNLSTLSSIVEP